MTDIPMTDDMLRIQLPDGIGYVEIRTGSVQGSTGNPVVAVEVTSSSLDTPAKDGRFYEPEFRRHHNAIHLVGYPDTVEDSHSAGCPPTKHRH